MPLTSKGQKILSAMQNQYGEEKGKEVFYASKNAGTISGVDAAPTNDQAPILQSYVPERQNLIGNVPTEEGGYRNDRKSGGSLAPTTAPQTGTIGNTIAGSKPEVKDRTIQTPIGDTTIPLGDEETTDTEDQETVDVDTSTTTATTSVPPSTPTAAPISATPPVPTTMDRKLRTGDSNPVGDQSIKNWNQRNRSFWKV